MRPNRREGFTLVELLVVIGILLLLTVMVVAVYNMSAGSDRMRSAARIGQSNFLGARDRALHAKERRGVRLVRDAADPLRVTGFVYVQPLPVVTVPVIVARSQATPDYQTNNATADDPQWLVVTGADVPLILSGSWVRVRIPAQTGNWYVLQSAPVSQNVPSFGQVAVFQLLAQYQGGIPWQPGDIVQAFNGQAEFDGGNELLPYHQPQSLPSGVVIDLEYSSTNVLAAFPVLPTPANADILFTPRGQVYGPLSALGPMHFLLRDVRDVGKDPAADLAGDQLILTVFPMTGNVASFPVDTLDMNNDGIADTPFRYAVTAQTAGQ